jgi:hypothetical protein
MKTYHNLDKEFEYANSIMTDDVFTITMEGGLLEIDFEGEYERRRVSMPIASMKDFIEIYLAGIEKRKGGE